MIRKLFASLSARTPRQDQRGASAIEYVMIIAVIVLAIAAGFALFGPDIEGIFEDLQGVFGGGGGE